MDEKLLLEFNTSYPLVKLFFYKKSFLHLMVSQVV